MPEMTEVKPEVITSTGGLKRSMQGEPRASLKQMDRAVPSQLHEVVIAVKWNNIEAYQEELTKRATPGSANYLQWWTFDEITQRVQNLEGFARVQKWLQDHDIHIKEITPRKDFIRAIANIATWETLLETEFYVFHDSSYAESMPESDGSPTVHIRCKSYTVPAHVKDDISIIFNTIQAPIPYKRSFAIRTEDGKLIAAENKQTFLRMEVNPTQHGGVSKQHIDTLASGSPVTVSFLNQLYEINSNLASPTFNQSVFETGSSTSSQYFSQSDLKQFQQTYGLTIQSAISIGGHQTSTCTATTCQEGNLDIQYIMGIAQRTSSIFWYVPGDNSDPYIDWIMAVAAQQYPPQANSISYGGDEQYFTDKSEMQVFCDQASLLAGNGVTITVSSGDNGVAGNSCLCGGTSAGYRPSFPATCPYVTAVGATMGPNQGDPEYACQSNTGGIITTGGGFSTYFLAQEWQKESITLYFNRLTAAQKPTTGYSTIGRGIPDISLMGVNYPTIIGGKTAYMYGTSASSPVFAGFITLANSIRQSSGLGTLGFLNPTLYQFGDNSTTGLPTLQNATFNDITSGYNKCCALQNYQINPTCCQAGFYAIEGWDPVTGWGSVNFPSFAIMASVVAPYYPASNNGGGSNNGAVAGIVVGVILAICCVGCIVAGVFYFFCRPKQDALLTQSYVTSSTPVQNTVPQAIVMGKVVTSDNRA